MYIIIMKMIADIIPAFSLCHHLPWQSAVIRHQVIVDTVIPIDRGSSLGMSRTGLHDLPSSPKISIPLAPQIRTPSMHRSNPRKHSHADLISLILLLIANMEGITIHNSLKRCRKLDSTCTGILQFVTVYFEPPRRAKASAL